jgi:tetratricopeptide (TPR) repeat protein
MLVENGAMSGTLTARYHPDGSLRAAGPRGQGFYGPGPIKDYLHAMAKTDSRSKNKPRFSLTLRQGLQIGVAVLLVLGLAGFVGHRWLQGWRYDKAIRDTQDFMRLGDPRSAAFAAKRAVQVRGDSVEAARMLAESLEKMNVVEAVLWRKKVVDLAPGDWRDHIAFAASAMKFRDARMASAALEKVDAAGRQNIDFLRTAADVTAALGQNDEAEKYLTEILSLDPYDNDRRLNLAALQIASKDEEKVKKARAEVEVMKDDPQLRMRALRILVREAARAGVRPALRFTLSVANTKPETPLANDDRLASLALELLRDEGTTVDDCLLSLEVLRFMDRPEFEENLSRLETAKFHSPGDLGDTMLWLNGRGFGARTVDWVERLPEQLKTTPELQLALADAWLLQKEWGMVLAIVEETDWGTLEAERLALSAIASRVVGDSQRATASWNLAELRLEQDVPRVRRLAEFCSRWSAEPEKEKLWWILASCPGDQNEVLKRLFTLSMKRKDGTGLYRAVKGLYLLNPEDGPCLNNYAWLSLLRGEDVGTSHKLADRVYAIDPKIGAYASTYAYSQHLRGRTGEGIKALEALPRAALNDPTVAGCYGFLLQAVGQKEKAFDFLGIARRSPDLLPEEAQLFLEKREQIDRSMEVPELRIFSSEA